MAYKKEINPWLKESGYTWKQMDDFWDECCEIVNLCGQLKRSGKEWSDLQMHLIKQLPTLKEKTLEQRRTKEIEEQEKIELEKKVKEEKDYYWEHFDEIMVNKIDNCEELTEKELKTIVFECKEISLSEGENRRWSRTNTSIIELCGRFFSIDWEEGLTENQDNEFYWQPFEVRKEEYEKTIIVTNWVKVNKDNKDED